MEDHKDVQGDASKLKREVDSLDDFEHLGHDSSPLVEVRGNVDTLLDLKTDIQAPACVLNERIDNKGESVGSSVTGSFDQLQDFDQPLIPQKMESNLFQMGDNFPEQHKDDKFASLMQDFEQGQKPAHQTQDKYNIQSFMDTERNMYDHDHDTPKHKPNPEMLDRYSDNELEEEEYVRSKIENVPEKNKDSEFHESIEHFKNDNFHDLIDIQQPLPKKDPNVVETLTESVTEPAKASSIVREPTPEFVKPHSEPVKTLTPEPAKETTPELVKEKTPEPVKEKTPEPAKQSPEPQQEPPKEPKKAEQKVAEVKVKIAPADAEVIFCKMGLDTWFNPERLNPNVESLIYWRDPKKSGPVFGGVLLILLALTYFSLISVVAYLSLITLTVTIAFRIYKNIVQAVQKTGDGHPFKDFLQMDVSLPQDKVKEICEVAVAHVNAAIVELRRLFLVEDLVDSIKFGVMLWTLTYLGAWFNGMSLIIIAWVALFTLPKVYETNKTQIDANLAIVRTKVAEITSKVKAAIPIGKKSEEKKEQ